MSILKRLSLQLFLVLACGPSVMSLSASAAFAPHAETAIPGGGVLWRSGLAEPLVSTASTTAAEDAALSEALVAFETREVSDDLRSLTGFVEAHPRSGWAPSVMTNLGLLYRHHGYFSRAEDAWQRAWTDGRTSSNPEARALVDRAVGELARLYASLGHVEKLKRLLAEIGDRPVSGPATELVQLARETSSAVEADPRHLFICGPLALKALLLAEGSDPAEVEHLQWFRASANGTNLAEVAALAEKASRAANYRTVFRSPGQPVPVPSIVHWGVGHFAAIVGQANERFRVQDSTIGGLDLWVTREAIDAEASGYFLVPASSTSSDGWREVATAEATSVWGKGPTTGTRLGDAGDPPANGGAGKWGSGSNGTRADGGSNSSKDKGSGGGNCGMCRYDIKESSVSVTLSDIPVGYTPPIGPGARTRISYNQREDSQPANFSFYNVSPKWTLNWLSYVTDDPANPGGSVSRYLSGGGAFYYSGYNAGSGSFAAQDDDGSILTLVAQSPVTYRRELRDGSTEFYSQSDGSSGYPRNVFLTKVVDPQGNSETLNYDGQRRLTSLTDATGRLTTFGYGIPGRPLLLKQVTDPFGRSATITYDGLGRLRSITDTIGIVSSVAYDANSLVNALTTPYGTTTFSYTSPGTSAPPRYAQATDPLGFSEREEWLEPAPIPDSDPAATVPQGMPVAPINQYLTYRNSFHWDKEAYVLAGCTPTGGCDYTKARIRHFLHMPNSTIKGTVVESVKYPLENRIWYNYPGQTSSIYGGTASRPSAVGRVLDDGTTQISRFSYDTSGFNLTQAVDPVGRTTQYTYAPNGIDLLARTQTTADGTTTFAQYTYDGKHRPLVLTDAAGQSTSLTYNEREQLATVTNPLGQTSSISYDANANVSTTTNANGQTASSFTYDSANRVRTVTDSEGWTVTYDYDAADRVTALTYPDGTSQTYAYDRLDLAAYRDRQFRVTRYGHDANQRLTSIIDPAGQQTLLAYNRRNQLAGLTDAKGYVTTWTYDVQGRPTTKQYADTTTVTYAYESASSRLHSVTDALTQTKSFTYASDDDLIGTVHSGAVNPTPDTAFTWDPRYPRVTSMTDGTGTTSYTYGASFTFAAGRLTQECVVPTGATACTSEINYAYDGLGRPASRAVTGAGTETFAYDTLGRLDSHGSDLGSFALSYLGQTSQPVLRQLLPSTSTLKTAWSYLPNSGDRRLSQIGATGLTTGQFTTLQFATTPENQFSGTTETSDTAALYPSTLTQTASFNNLNELTTLSGQARTYDLLGNLLTDGQRGYTWDAENRLLGITYPGAPGKATTFTYDGLGRRVAIGETPAGGGAATTTRYAWCGSALCQSRDASGARVRSYYPEGEFVASTPGQSLFYGLDQVGSVRRAFASTTSAPAYAYDPYGVPLGTTAPVTDFGYAGLLNHPASGLYLAQYRGYDPIAGRWLSRDPLGETSDPAANLFRYANGNPVSLMDPRGQFGLVGALIGGAVGAFGAGIGDAALQIYRNGGFQCFSGSEAAAAALLGGGIGAVLAGTFGVGLLTAEAGTALGDLTASEVSQIQDVVDAAGRPLDVVGSAARAARTSSSDIDYTTANANLGNFEGLQGQLPGIDPEHGILRGNGDPNIGPSVRFEPGSNPNFLRGLP